MGALLYNFQKVDTGKGCVLNAQNIRQATDGGFTLALCYSSFEPYLMANQNTEKPALHISINPDPKDNVDDRRYIKLASDYMREMGYGQQPFIVFKHTDIERTHIHIVSTNVDGLGKKISDTYEHKRSMDVCRALEKKYRLTPPAKGQDLNNDKLFKPVDHKKENIKSQIAAVVRYLPQYYHYQSLGGYNALLSLFNITAQEVSGELNGKPRHGLVYFALDTESQKVSHPFKASLFGKSAGHAALTAQFEKAKDVMKDAGLRNIVKNVVEIAMYTSKNKADFIGQLKSQGVNVVVRSNTEGRIYGITFVDHNSKCVWNGSQLGKDMAANIFEQWWNSGIMPKNTGNSKDFHDKHGTEAPKIADFPANESNEGAEGILGGIMDLLLPADQGEDYEEQAFANRIKKRKKKNK